jgi:ubiquinone/menaquinone biosynthesis C-methylase UbiE
MDRVVDASELLDGPLTEPAVLAGNLRDLRRVNRLLGGVALSRAALDRLAPGPEPLTMIDVGTGAADIPVGLIQARRRQGRRLDVLATDDRQAILDAALAVDPGLRQVPGLRLAVADGLDLPYPDGAFDVGHVSLVLHHLGPADAVTLLRELRRVARLGVVINDLDRTPLALFGARLLARIATRNRYTRHDAPLSVRRAYRPGEARELLRAAGLRPVSEHRSFVGQRWAIAAVPIGGQG